MAFPARIDESGCGMNDQPDASKAALALQPRHQIVGQLYVLQRTAQHEFPGMKDEGSVVTNFYDFGKVFQPYLDVYMRASRVGEDENLAVQTKVDAGRLNIFGI